LYLILNREAILEIERHDRPDLDLPRSLVGEHALAESGAQTVVLLERVEIPDAESLHFGQIP
jgi:hypothetical protein